MSARPDHTELPLWQRIRIVLVLGSLMALGPLTIDTYLPAFPAITENLDASRSAVQLTLTGTLLGIAVGQLLVGSLSDVFGRRRPLFVAVAVHVTVSVACAVAPNVAVLGLLRVLQGMAAAAGAVVAMAVVRDLFAGVSGAIMFSRLMLVMGVAPVLAPTLGAQLLLFTDWRGIFWVLALIGAVLLPVVWFGLRETLPPERRRRTGIGGTLTAYGQLLRERKFVALMATGGMTMAALFTYISGSSFVFQELYRMTEQEYGLLFGANAVGLILATQVNARLAVRFGPHRVLGTAVLVAVAASAALVVMALTGWFGLPGLAGPLFVVLSMVGFILPNVPALALADHGSAAGTAASLIGAANFGTGALSAPLAGAVGAGTAVPMGAVMLLATLGAATAFHLVARPRIIRSADHELSGRGQLAELRATEPAGPRPLPKHGATARKPAASAGPASPPRPGARQRATSAPRRHVDRGSRPSSTKG